MGKTGTAAEIELEISDVSGQKVFSVANAPVANTVGELIQEWACPVRTLAARRFLTRRGWSVKAVISTPLNASAMLSKAAIA